jgi:myo-inositol-1(or 4)-monophosphatase
MSKLFLEVAIKCALEAGKLLKSGFGTNFKISNKEGLNNLVTEYDTSAERLIIEIIRESFPTHSILAEESGYTESDTNYRWIIDPLDGTVNFANNLPIFSVSIALEERGKVICGVVYQPILDELFYARRGKGAYLNGTKINVSSKSDIKSAFLVTGFPYNVSENPKNTIDHFVKIIGAGIPVRRLGSAALDLCYVANGRFDAFWEVYLHPWDIAAGWLILEEAGGNICHYNGKNYTFEGESVIATNGLLKNDIINLLK